MFWLGLAASVAYVPGVTGAAIPTGWAFLLVSLPILLINKRINFILFHWLFVSFLCYACLSLLWGPNVYVGIFSFFCLVVWYYSFLLGFGLSDASSLYKGFAIGLGISVIVALLQMFGFNGIFHVCMTKQLCDYVIPAGLFFNYDTFCEVSVIVLLLLLSQKLYWWCIVSLPGIVMVHSRAAILALCASLLVWFWSISKIAVVAVLLIGCMFIYLNRSHVHTLTDRTDIWLDTIAAVTPLGHGIGSFEMLYPKYAERTDTIKTRPKYAHNETVQFVFELGIGILLLLPLFAICLLVNSDERLVLIAIGVIAQFQWTLHVPLLAFITFIVVGRLVRVFYGNRGTSFYRGSILSFEKLQIS